MYNFWNNTILNDFINYFNAMVYFYSSVVLVVYLANGSQNNGPTLKNNLPYLKKFHFSHNKVNVSPL